MQEQFFKKNPTTSEMQSGIEKNEFEVEVVLQALDELAQSIFANPAQATELLTMFVKQFPTIQPVDLYGMLALPGELISITGEDLLRAEKVAGLLKYYGEKPLDLLASKTCVVIESRLLQNGQTVSPLNVRVLSADELSQIEQKKIEFPGSEDEFVMVKPSRQ